MIKYLLSSDGLSEELVKANSVIVPCENVELLTNFRVDRLIIEVETLSLKRFRDSCENLEINYGLVTTPFGEAFVAIVLGGICSFEFVDSDFNEVFKSVKDKWVNSTFIHNDIAVQEVVEPFLRGEKGKIKLLLKGTPFQIMVWKALLLIPRGRVLSYSQLALLVGMPKGVRAVASAVAKNPIGFLIPCHRVIRQSGDVGNYHWQSRRKRLMICQEMVKR